MAQLAIDFTSEAIAQSEANADGQWMDKAIGCVRRLAKERMYITANDVLDMMEKEDESTHSLRAVGPVMLAAKKLGIIKNTGQKSTSVNTHGTPITLWEVV